MSRPGYPGSMKHLRHGLDASIRANYTAYGFSVMITASFGVLASEQPSPGTGEIFIFVLGAVLAFILIDVVVTRGFRRSPESESPQAAPLGAAFALGSVTFGVGGAALLGSIDKGSLIWGLGSFAATTIYVVLAGIELAIAEQLKR